MVIDMSNLDIIGFNSYYTQIKSVMDTEPECILEIGIGNKITSSYLKNRGKNIVTCDINPDLCPDKIGDIRALPFESNSFDTILCCEVLEHIPFTEFEKALSELHRVSKKYVIISIPYACFYMDISIITNIPFLYKLLRPNISIPFFTHKFEYDGIHHWEMGTKQYPRKRIRIIMNKYFTILKEVSPLNNPYHYFFILEKRVT